MTPIIPLIVLLLGGTPGAQGSSTTPTPERPRLVVLTDIGSLEAGIREPDDGQSLIRLMLYSDEFDIEGLIASSNLGHGQRVQPGLLRRVVDAYAAARPNLILHDDRYPPAESLAALIRAGQPVAGPEVPVAESVGEGKDTEASEWIIRVVDRDDARPVWVLIWGGSADLAQALWRVRRDRGPDELARFLAKLRIHAIGDQDSTGPWIRDEFPGLFTITQRRAYRGMYRGGDESLVSSEWVQAHIHGHGPLGDLYPDYHGGDIWSGTLGPVRGIKEGDTPSFLFLVPNGLGGPAHPGLGSWGGRFAGEGNRLEDVPDSEPGDPSDPDPRMSSVYRWRPEFQADFRARLDWCIAPRDGANHPPVVRIAGARERVVAPGEVVVLDAGATIDPDGDELTFEWSIDPARDVAAIILRDRSSNIARLEVPPDSAGGTIPVFLRVRDRGEPGLTRYGRVLMRINLGE